MSYSLNSLKGGLCRGLSKVISRGIVGGLARVTLPETNMETKKGPYKDYSPSKRVLYGFPC